VPQQPVPLTCNDCGGDQRNTGRNYAEDVSSARSSPTTSEPALRAHVATLSRAQTTTAQYELIPLTVAWTGRRASQCDAGP